MKTDLDVERDDAPDGGRVIDAIVADLKHNAERRRFYAREWAKRQPPDAADRARLLERARTGDAEATTLLWQRYRLRLVPVERRCRHCSAPLGKKNAKGLCRRCYNTELRRKRGVRARHHGPCIVCGQRPGRGISGKCRRCYRLGFFGTKRRELAWRTFTGSPLSVQQVRDELAALGTSPALAAVQTLLRQVEAGVVLLERNPWIVRQGSARRPA